MNDDLLFVDRLRDPWPPADWRDVTVLVAVSGGADSVSLLCGLAELRDQEKQLRTIQTSGMMMTVQARIKMTCVSHSVCRADEL